MYGSYFQQNDDAPAQNNTMLPNCIAENNNQQQFYTNQQQQPEMGNWPSTDLKSVIVLGIVLGLVLGNRTKKNKRKKNCT